LREWIIPEVVDAYVKGDVETLKQWFSEAVLSLPLLLLLLLLLLLSPQSYSRFCVLRVLTF